MKKLIVITSALLFGLFVSPSFAVEVTLFGPSQYLRTTGKPNVYTGTFPGIAGQGKLLIKNGGASGSNRVSSALISLNGQQILGPNSFNQQVSNIEVPVNLKESNSISIELRSKPGSYIYLHVKQDVQAAAAALIGPTGGVIEVTDSSSPIYGVKVEIPANSLTQNTVVTVDQARIEITSSDKVEVAMVTPPISIKPDYTNTAGDPFIITIPYKDDDNDGIIDGTDFYEEFIKVFFLPEDTSSEMFMADSVTIDRVNNKIIILSDHFSTYSALVHLFRKGVEFFYYVDSLPYSNTYPKELFEKDLENIVFHQWEQALTDANIKFVRTYDRLFADFIIMNSDMCGSYKGAPCDTIANTNPLLLFLYGGPVILSLNTNFKCGSTTWVAGNDAYCQYPPPITASSIIPFARIVMHEVGHILGLPDTTTAIGCQLKGALNYCPNYTSCNNNCSSLEKVIMFYDSPVVYDGDGKNIKGYPFIELSPCDIAKIRNHYNLEPRIDSDNDGYIDACDNCPNISNPDQAYLSPHPHSISVTPAFATVPLTACLQFIAPVLDQCGNPITPQPSLDWKSSNTLIGTIDATGLFTATSVGGPINVTASVGPFLSGSASVTVIAPTPVLTSITITPATATLSVGSTQQFTATGLDQYGNPMVPQPSFRWASSNTAIGIVDPTGLFIGVSVGGPITVSASVGSISENASVTVTAPTLILTSITVSPAIAALTVGDTQQFTATGFDQFNSPMVPQPSFTWASSNTAIGTVNNTGLFSALSAGGPINVTASVGSISGSASVTVSTPAPVLTSIGVTPATATVTVGSTQQFTATALDQYGNPIFPQSSFTWISSNTSVGTVNNTGLFSALSIGGPISVTASVGSINGSASVTVIAIPPAQSPWPMFGHDHQHTGRSQYNGPESINIRWVYDFGFVVNESCGRTSLQPVIGKDGVMYFGIGEAQCGEKPPWGKLYAINPNGTLKWDSFDLGSPVFSAPAIGPDGTIYVPTYDKGIYTLNPDGTEKWRFYEEGIGFVTAISIGSDGIIYFTNGQKLYSLNPDGSTNWIYCCDVGNPAWGGPAIGANGDIYIVIQWPFSLNAALQAYSPDGSFRWSVNPYPGYAGYGYGRVTAPSVGHDGVVYVAVGHETGVAWRLHAFNQGGQEIWQTPIVGPGYPQGSPVIDASGNIIVAANWNQLCGEILWCSASGLYAFAPNGDFLWQIGPHGGQASNNTRFRQPIVDAQGTVFVAESISPGGYWLTGRLYSISQDGTIKNTIDVPGEVFSSPVIGAGGHLYAVFGEHQESLFYMIKVYAFGP